MCIRNPKHVLILCKWMLSSLCMKVVNNNPLAYLREWLWNCLGDIVHLVSLKKNSCICLFTQATVSMNQISGYFILSDANEINKTSCAFALKDKSHLNWWICDVMILFVTQTSTWIRKTNYTKLWFIVYHNVQNSVIEIQSEIKKEE